MSCEQRALLQDLIIAAPYGDDDKSQCLISLAGGQSRKPRTKQQDATHCLEYLSEKEWQLIPRLGQLGVLQLVFDVLVSRMQCFNPTEHTLKWVASSVIISTTPKDELALVTEDQAVLVKLTPMTIDFSVLQIKSGNNNRKKPLKNEIRNEQLVSIRRILQENEKRL